MDARDAVDRVIGRVEKEYHAGNYRVCVELLLPLLRAKRKKKLSPQQECDAEMWLSDSYRFLDDDKAALPHAKRFVELWQQNGPRSKGHAVALQVLCTVQRGLKALPAARKSIVEALSIMDGLGLQQQEEYGSMLVALGRLDYDEKRYKEALVVFNKAKVVLAKFKEGVEYGALINNMALCHEKLHQWNEAVACDKEASELARVFCGSNHPDYGAALWNLAWTDDAQVKIAEAGGMETVVDALRNHRKKY
jgi:tetratricopeptide (TPR) repeat protein